MNAAQITTAVRQLAPAERTSLIAFVLGLLKDIAREFLDDILLAVADLVEDAAQGRPPLVALGLTIVAKAARFTAARVASA